MLWALPLAMAAGSYLQQDQQNKNIDRQNRAQSQAAAAQTQFSPWTKLGKGQYEYKMGGSAVGAGVQGGLQGAAMSQNFDVAQSQQNLAQSQMDLNKAQQQYYTQNSPWSRPRYAQAQMGMQA